MNVQHEFQVSDTNFIMAHYQILNILHGLIPLPAKRVYLLKIHSVRSVITLLKKSFLEIIKILKDLQLKSSVNGFIRSFKNNMDKIDEKIKILITSTKQETVIREIENVIEGMHSNHDLYNNIKGILETRFNSQPNFAASEVKSKPSLTQRVLSGFLGKPRVNSQPFQTLRRKANRSPLRELKTPRAEKREVPWTTPLGVTNDVESLLTQEQKNERNAPPTVTSWNVNDHPLTSSNWEGDLELYELEQRIPRHGGRARTYKRKNKKHIRQTKSKKR